MSDESTAPLTAHEALDCAIAILIRAQDESPEIDLDPYLAMNSAMIRDGELPGAGPFPICGNVTPRPQSG
jgi:hypothetical protein